MRCGVADAGAAALGRALRGSPLEELRLDDNRVGDDGARGLGEGLASARLRVLGLRDNCVCSPGLLALLAGLGRRIESRPTGAGLLDLDDNHTDGGVMYVIRPLLHAARDDPMVRGLRVGGNAWLPKDAEKLADALAALVPPRPFEALATPKKRLMYRTAPLRAAPSPRRFLQLAATKKRTPKRVPGLLMWGATM